MRLVWNFDSHDAFLLNKQAKTRVNNFLLRFLNKKNFLVR